MYTLADYKQKSDLIEKLIDYLPSAIIVLDHNTSIVLANKMAEQFAQKSRQDIFGMRGGEAFGCIHANDAPEGCGYGDECKRCMVRTTVEKTLKTRENLLNVEAPMEFDEIGERTLAISTTWLPSNQLVIVALNDITDQKHREILRLENTKLQAAIQTSGAVCHEMNQPLFVISGITEIMQMEWPENPGVMEWLEKIQEQVGRMGNITKRLMHISQFKEKIYLDETILDLETSTLEL